MTVRVGRKWLGLPDRDDMEVLCILLVRGTVDVITIWNFSTNI